MKTWKLDAYAPSVDEIVAYGLDESGAVARFQKRLRHIESEYGAGCVAAQMQKNQFGDVYGYGWQREVRLDNIDETGAYNTALMEKMISFCLRVEFRQLMLPIKLITNQFFCLWKL